MSWSILWPWRPRRAKAAPPRRKPSPLQLTVEALEDRVVPSGDAAYQAWRQMTFKIDDAAGPTIQVDQVKTAAVPTNNSFGSLIGLPSVFTNTPYRGNGYAVAFIDTGIDYKNANLGGGFGPGYRVVAGWDFANNDADPLDDNGHGTHVAGIVGSSHATYSGVAPNVNLIALKVLDKRGGGTFGNVESALQWVAANRARYNIVAVNLSLGTGNYTANPFTFMDDEFTALKNGGVFISVAAGNSFYAYNSAVGLDYPAISPLVVSVGAVWAGNFGTVAWANGARDNSTAADRIASFSQRGPALSIMSPGAIITSTYLNNTLKGMSGTSMASPVIAGAAVLIHQAMDALKLPANQDTILSVLKKTGVNVKDGDDENDNVVNTGLTFKRLDLNTALKSLGTPTNSAPMLQTIADATVAPGGTRVITLSGSDPNGDAITFSASVVGAGPSQAYQLKQQLGLTYLGSYYQNAWGQNEKWLSSTNRTWYAILPSGQLRRWAGSMTATLQAANLIATLDPSFYADPSKLWNAQPPSAPPLTLSISGNRLTIAAPTNAGGSYQIQVTASDGKAFTTQSFRLTIQADAPASNWALVSSGDFNGDGKADVLAFDKAGSLWVGIATAKGTALARWTQWAAASLWSSLNVADVNGDGKADFVGKYANGKWYVAYSTGAAFRTQSWTGSTAPITK